MKKLNVFLSAFEKRLSGKTIYKVNRSSDVYYYFKREFPYDCSKDINGNLILNNINNGYSKKKIRL